jgi:hypothetical protein
LPTEAESKGEREVGDGDSDPQTIHGRHAGNGAAMFS